MFLKLLAGLSLHPHFPALLVEFFLQLKSSPRPWHRHAQPRRSFLLRVSCIASTQWVCEEGGREGRERGRENAVTCALCVGCSESLNSSVNTKSESIQNASLATTTVLVNVFIQHLTWLWVQNDICSALHLIAGSITSLPFNFASLQTFVYLHIAM